ncbi:hypothetical protein FB451DRAFT_1394993 [Mycena latifolia]|nr:hypothetical protein FB451DRAFT_1394993 [Mycena latifolia]
MDDLSPLYLSRLEVFSPGGGKFGRFQTSSNHAILRLPSNDQVLNVFTVNSIRMDVIDISTLQNLVLIRFSQGNKEGSHRHYLDGNCCEEFDSSVVSLPMHPMPIVELENSPFDNRTTEESFRRLAARDLLRVIVCGTDD